MLEAAFIDARRARKVKAVGQAAGERGAGKATWYGRAWQALLPNNLRSRSRVSGLLTVYSVHGLTPAIHDLTARTGAEFAGGHPYAGWHYA